MTIVGKERYLLSIRNKEVERADVTRSSVSKTRSTRMAFVMVVRSYLWDVPMTM